MKLELTTLKNKVDSYKGVLDNTQNYRVDWNESLKPMVIEILNKIVKETNLKADVIVKDQVENLEAIVLDLGRTHSGMREKVEESDIKKTIVKTQGAVVYQQLFNGKVMVMFIYPYIEGYGEPKAPNNLEILRPHELKQENIVGHIEGFIDEITAWEDYDDDLPAKKAIGFTNPIGFQQVLEAGDISNVEE